MIWRWQQSSLSSELDYLHPQVIPGVRALQGTQDRPSHRRPRVRDSPAPRLTLPKDVPHPDLSRVFRFFRASSRPAFRRQWNGLLRGKVLLPADPGPRGGTAHPALGRPGNLPLDQLPRPHPGPRNSCCPSPDFPIVVFLRIGEGPLSALQRPDAQARVPQAFRRLGAIVHLSGSRMR